jgi:hypothetical protein
MRVYVRNSATSFTPVFESKFGALTSGSENHFATSFPVDGGEFIGLLIGPSVGSSSCVASSIGSDLYYSLPPPSPVGSPDTFTSVGSALVDVAAVVEADSDCDGLGDETQDSNVTFCPVPPPPAGGSPPADTDPPDTTITKGAPFKTDLSKVKYKFVSDEQGSTFECKIDKNPFKPCSSPKTVKHLAEGKHKFNVRAIDTAGNVDPTAAKDKFKVVG